MGDEQKNANRNLNPLNDPDIQRGLEEAEQRAREQREMQERSARGEIEQPYEVKTSGETPHVPPPKTDQKKPDGSN